MKDGSLLYLGTIPDTKNSCMEKYWPENYSAKSDYSKERPCVKANHIPTLPP